MFCQIKTETIFVTPPYWLRTPNYNTMIGLQQKVNFQMEVKKGTMHVNYERRANRTIYDICDTFGRILISGNMSGINTDIDIQNLAPSSYIFLILDGDRAISRRFTVAA